MSSAGKATLGTLDREVTQDCLGFQGPLDCKGRRAARVQPPWPKRKVTVATQGTRACRAREGTRGFLVGVVQLASLGRVVLRVRAQLENQEIKVSPASQVRPVWKGRLENQGGFSVRPKEPQGCQAMRGNQVTTVSQDFLVSQAIVMPSRVPPDHQDYQDLMGWRGCKALLDRRVQ